jgi:UDP-N-acetyl-D-glucosamine dehydrogenase
MNSMLEQKIKDKKAVISVLGLGHVGYPMASLFAKNGFCTIGFDVAEKRLNDIIQGKTLEEIYPLLPTTDVAKEKVLEDITKRLTLSRKEQILGNADIFVVAVPTPLKENETPNLIFLENTCKTISKFIKPGVLVIIESTIYPGATEEIVKPLLEKSGFRAGIDFYLCYSPERIDPGRIDWNIQNIPKIVGGINKKSCDLGCMLYSQIVSKVVPVSSLKVAEATKMLENLFRSVNIALIYDITKLFEKLEIDIWETITAASTKPFTFMAHYPGPGVGGHCIPKDPFYLLYKARKTGVNVEFIEEAAAINQSMPLYIIHMVEETLRTKDKTINDSSFGVLGVTYKKDVADTRRTPAKTIINELSRLSDKVTVFDPYVSESFGAENGSFEETLSNKDCIILVVDHSYFRKNEIERKINDLSPNCCLIDTRNFFLVNKLKESITYRCLGKPFRIPKLNIG